MSGREKRRSWIRVLDAALSSVLVGLLAAGPALAQQPPQRLLPPAPPAGVAPKLTVLVVPLDAAAQAQVPRLMYQAEQDVAGAGRFSFVPLADALDAQGAREREAKAGEAAAAFKEGQKAYDELDTQKALQQFDKAAQTYEASDLSRHFADMSRARVMKIASYVANGDTKAFLRELKEVLARNPRAEFSSNYFPADELAVVEKTRKAILNEANKTLQVKTGEVSGRVFVDGQLQGFSPVTLSGLTASEHFVTVIAPGYAQAQGKARGEASLTLQPLPAAQRLSALEKRLADDPDGMARDAALRELGTLTETQQVVALMVRATPGAAGTPDAIAVRVDVADGHNLAYATAPLPLAGEATDTGIRSLLASVLQTDAPRVEGKPVHVPTLQTGSGSKTAGYALLATGAALVAGGVYFGLQASSKSDQFKKTPQTDINLSETLRSDGKRFALIADVGVIAGLISGGVGSWLAFAGGGGGGGQAEARPSSPVQPPAPKPAPTPAPKSTPSREVTPAPAPSREPAPAPRPAEKPVTAPAPAPAPAPQGKPAANTRAEEERRAREEAAKREQEERLKREEAAKREQEERLKREEAAKREQEERLKRDQAGKREQEERLKREEAAKREEEAKRKAEEQKKREEEDKKKKKPSLDEDDLRNY